ncbi:hypothetical protein BMJ29_02720 [Sinorhizobium medicae]|uniref:Uncharacterized protein n=1 Tax=Sinorhizobium medicae TaxID=110321 RepID=A0ABX4TT03_9HYPH|nr:hypothetical protein BMJ33_00640 [Sinorhizobium medicae]PLU16132.1 hypothetical protein BMJ30_17795 [Sinorhizobium medicae]PLU24255.1 hypothetical protein BMJ29_02720 [Sinorhizobium medicae]PLU35031.1 hypothetical protein BMJ27_14000 [Sinorhizobium medicae]PLU81156.1 hypothetical protein BMJ19_04510 [Sinorhizobium medicae]
MPRKVAIRAGRRDFGCRAWQERGRSITDLVGQRRGRKLEALAFETDALAVERERPASALLLEAQVFS